MPGLLLQELPGDNLQRWCLKNVGEKFDQRYGSGTPARNVATWLLWALEEAIKFIRLRAPK